MENNNQQPVVPQTPSPQPPVGQVPSPQSAAPQATSKPEATIVNDRGASLNIKMIVLAVGILLLLVVLGGGVYWYLQNQSASVSAPIETQQIQRPTAPQATREPDLETQLNALDSSTSADEFSSIDQDINSL